MQLKIQRSQRMGGVFAGAVVFCLDVRADYTEEERHNINKYRLGGEVIYNSQAARKHLDRAGTHLDRTQSRDLKEQMAGLARGGLSMVMAKMSLNISIASLGRGHHIECKDLNELLEAEDTVREACKNVTRFLQVAETFDGSELVVEYENGEERVHITQHAPALVEYKREVVESDEAGEEFAGHAAAPGFAGTMPGVSPADDPFMELGRYVRRLGSEFAEQGRSVWQKAAAFIASKGWDKLAREAAEAGKQRWLTFEQKILAFAEDNGWPVNTLHIRIASGVVAGATVSAIVILLYELL